MGELIVEHEGTLEHFAGDGFMTFFNDPVLQPDHAARAIGMAVAMRDRFAGLSADWRRRGHVLEIGIGIATGYATLGRIGFEGRYDYGAIGNAIILASRLSGEAGPGEILVAARTFAEAEADERIDAEPAGERSLKGFSRAVPRTRSAGRRAIRIERPRGIEVTLDPSAMSRLLEITGGDVAFVDELIDTFLEDATVQLVSAPRRWGGERCGGHRAAGTLAQVEQRQRWGGGPRRSLPVARGRWTRGTRAGDGGADRRDRDGIRIRSDGVAGSARRALTGPFGPGSPSRSSPGRGIFSAPDRPRRSTKVLSANRQGSWRFGLWTLDAQVRWRDSNVCPRR